MKGYRINPDKNFVFNIIEGTEKKNGYCPCKIKQIDENLCPCDEFISTGMCKCKLFIPNNK